MSVFGPNHSGAILTGSTYETEALSLDFINGGTDKAVQVFQSDGTPVAADSPFKIYQKSANAKAGFEFSEIIDPKSVDYVKVEKYAAPVQREIQIEGFTGTVRNNCTYEVFIRLYNDGGTNSVENFRMIPAFYVSPADASAVTFTDVLNELKVNLDKTLAKENNELFTTSVDTGNGYFIVQGNNRPFILGKKDGTPVQFDLQAAVRDNGSQSVTSGNRYDDLSVTVNAVGNNGVGTGTQAANLEWFYKGYLYSRYRDTAYPNNFSTVYNVDPASTYHVAVISYYKERSYVNVEKQHRLLYILMDATAGVVDVNLLITDLATATGLTIPALV